MNMAMLLQTKTWKRNVPGIYAAGDVRQKMLRQVVTATGDGKTVSQHKTSRRNTSKN